MLSRLHGVVSLYALSLLALRIYAVPQGRGRRGWGEKTMALITPRNAQLICECNVSVAGAYGGVSIREKELKHQWERARATQRDKTLQLPGVSSHVSSLGQARSALLCSHVTLSTSVCRLPTRLGTAE